ncbi:hypothetical protein [Cupriavidus sp. YAF13]|uniref:hypothetical protein n=1 Tax=Cupriavidus sp. YAF13 TaxID=3233075 RepID=UPI003F8DE14B
MHSIFIEPTNEQADARRQIEAYCQSLVDVGTAQWRVGDTGDTGAIELHMESGEAYLFGDWGVTRLR